MLAAAAIRLLKLSAGCRIAPCLASETAGGRFPPLRLFSGMEGGRGCHGLHRVPPHGAPCPLIPFDPPKQRPRAGPCPRVLTDVRGLGGPGRSSRPSRLGISPRLAAPPDALKPPPPLGHELDLWSLGADHLQYAAPLQRGAPPVPCAGRAPASGFRRNRWGPPGRARAFVPRVTALA